MDYTEYLALFDGFELYQSDFVDRHAVTTYEGLTAWGCLRQAQRELNHCQRGLEELYLGLEQLHVEIAELDGSLRSPRERLAAWWHGEAYRRVKLIRLKAKRAALPHLLANIADTERRFRGFLGQVRALRASVGDLTPERRREYEREWWVRHFVVEAIVSRGQGLTPHSIRLLAAMPADVREPARAELRQHSRLAFDASHGGDGREERLQVLQEFEARYTSSASQLLADEPADVDVRGLLTAEIKGCEIRPSSGFRR